MSFCGLMYNNVHLLYFLVYFSNISFLLEFICVFLVQLLQVICFLQLDCFQILFFENQFPMRLSQSMTTCWNNIIIILATCNNSDSFFPFLLHVNYIMFQSQTLISNFEKYFYQIFQFYFFKLIFTSEKLFVFVSYILLIFIFSEHSFFCHYVMYSTKRDSGAILSKVAAYGILYEHLVRLINVILSAAVNLEFFSHNSQSFFLHIQKITWKKEENKRSTSGRQRDC